MGVSGGRSAAMPVPRLCQESSGEREQYAGRQRGGLRGRPPTIAGGRQRDNTLLEPLDAPRGLNFVPAVDGVGVFCPDNVVKDTTCRDE